MDELPSGLTSALRVKASLVARGYESASIAINASKEMNQTEVVKNANALLPGSLIDRLGVSDSQLTLVTDQNYRFSITAFNEGVIGKIQKNMEGDSGGAKDNPHSLGSSVLLDFCVPGMQPVKWARNEALECRVGAKINKISESDFGLLLYVEGFAVLQFSGLNLIDYPKTNPVLYWEEIG